MVFLCWYYADSRLLVLINAQHQCASCVVMQEPDESSGFT